MKVCINSRPHQGLIDNDPISWTQSWQHGICRDCKNIKQEDTT